METFKNLSTTKYGDMGEAFIPQFCKSKGAQPYQPSLEESNPVDAICLKNYKPFAVEAKTKAKMLMRDNTGYDIIDHETYMRMEIPTYILFVDHLTQSIYGQWVSKLDAHKEKMGSVYIFPLEQMDEYRKLTQDEVEALKKASNSKWTKIEPQPQVEFKYETIEFNITPEIQEQINITKQQDEDEMDEILNRKR